MSLIYLCIGIIVAVIGAIPLGATNIAVINTTIKQNSQEALKITLAAGIAEVVLAGYALHYNTSVSLFFNSNQWLQITIAFVLLALGGIQFFKSTTSVQRKSQFKINKYAIGFFLGLLNPPVLVYWLVIYGFINTYTLPLTTASSWFVICLFLIGVYLGKILTLNIYGKFSLYIQKKFYNINQVLNKVTGSLLFFIGLINVAKFYFA